MVVIWTKKVLIRLDFKHKRYLRKSGFLRMTLGVITNNLNLGLV